VTPREQHVDMGEVLPTYRCFIVFFLLLVCIFLHIAVNMRTDCSFVHIFCR